VAGASSNAVGVLLGNGDGTFQEVHFFLAGNYASQMVAADFNKDGMVDVAVTNNFSQNIAVFINDTFLFKPVRGIPFYELFY